LLLAFPFARDLVVDLVLEVEAFRFAGAFRFRFPWPFPRTASAGGDASSRRTS
jgi:hypothetical protein